MQRREFVAASLAGSLWPSVGRAGDAQGGGSSGGPAPQVLELRRYRFRFGPMEARFAEYAKGVLIPAFNRAGVKPVGAFSVALGPDSPSVYLLLPHAGAESVPALAGRLSADPEYKRAAAAFRNLPSSDPLYVSRESTLMVAFDSAPAVEIPSGPLAAPSRVFELRTYVSHSEAANLKKIEMFESGGELAIFRRIGITPVFFARNLIGPLLPSLSYMVVFPDAAGRDRSWAAFRDDPAWVKLRGTAGYSNAEIMTSIHNMLLRPTDYSQL
jgi:hypothetical protein